jgi:methylmalonyl-CoA/ethylmalonyl-CoA epimerase
MKQDLPTQLTNGQLCDIGIVARDINKTVKRLEVMGIGPFLAPKPDADAQGMFFRGKPLKGDFRAIIAHSGNANIEIFEVHSKPSPWEELIKNRGEGIHHLGFRIDDVEKEANRLAARGAEVVLTCMGRGKMEAAYVDLKVANIVIEIMSYPRPEQPPPADMTFAKPWDACVLVNDLDKAMARMDTLGIGEAITGGGPPEGAEGLFYRGKLLESGFKARLFRVGNMSMEFIQPDNKPNPWSEFLKTKGEGFHHVGFYVKDVEGAVNHLTALGAAVPFYGKISGKMGAAYVDMKTANLFMELTNFGG